MEVCKNVPSTFFSMVRDSCPLSAWSSKKAMKRRVADRAEAGSRDNDCENIIWKTKMQVNYFNKLF